MLFKMDVDDELGAQLVAEGKRRRVSRAELLRQAAAKFLADSERERIEALEDLTSQHGRKLDEHGRRIAALERPGAASRLRPPT